MKRLIIFTIVILGFENTVAYPPSGWTLVLAKSCSDNTGDNGTTGEKDSGYNITASKQVLIFIRNHNGLGYTCATGSENAYVIESKNASATNISMYTTCAGSAQVTNWARSPANGWNASSATTKFSALTVGSNEVRIDRSGRVYFYNASAGNDSSYWVFEK